MMKSAHACEAFGLNYEIHSYGPTRQSGDVPERGACSAELFVRRDHGAAESLEYGNAGCRPTDCGCRRLHRCAAQTRSRLRHRSRCRREPHPGAVLSTNVLAGQPVLPAQFAGPEEAIRPNSAPPSGSAEHADQDSLRDDRQFEAVDAIHQCVRDRSRVETGRSPRRDGCLGCGVAVGDSESIGQPCHGGDAATSLVDLEGQGNLADAMHQGTGGYPRHQDHDGDVP